jgi:hypothetical protein
MKSVGRKIFRQYEGILLGFQNGNFLCSDLRSIRYSSSSPKSVEPKSIQLPIVELDFSLYSDDEAEIFCRFTKPESVRQGLRVYKKLYGHLLIPNRFVIPHEDDAWPERLWGVRLGSVVSRIRSGRYCSSMRDELEELGFDYSPQRTPPYSEAAVRSGVATYLEVFGDTFIARDFKVPRRDNAWPEELWGMRLGRAVHSIRNGEYYVSLGEEFRDMGVDFGSKRRYNIDEVRIALVRYKQLYGDKHVPKMFEVPMDDDIWPVETWGMNLGSIIARARSHNHHRPIREEMMQMGVIPELRTRREFGEESVRLVLSLYMTVYGNLLVPLRFVIPSQSMVWPEDMWGLRLGAMVSRIRAGYCYVSMREELEVMGFEYGPLKLNSHGEDAIRQALTVYKEKHGDMLVSSNFEVPLDDDSWPKDTWGMKLGDAVAGIRAGVCYKHMKNELVSIGFDFGRQRSKMHGMDAVRSCLIRFKEIHGNLEVKGNFIIPTNSLSWPEEFWGMRLGDVVTNMRCRDTYPALREEMMEMGLDYTPVGRRAHGDDLVRLVLGIYKSIYGNLLIPYSFRIPKDDDDWPRNLWGMQLGALAARIRRNLCYVNMRDELLLLGFVYADIREKVKDDDVEFGLQQFREFNG